MIKHSPSHWQLVIALPGSRLWKIRKWDYDMEGLGFWGRLAHKLIWRPLHCLFDPPWL